MYLVLASGTHLTELEEGSMKWIEKTEIFFEKQNFLILDLKGKIKYTLIPTTEADKVITPYLPSLNLIIIVNSGVILRFRLQQTRILKLKKYYMID